MTRKSVMRFSDKVMLQIKSWPTTTNSWALPEGCHGNADAPVHAAVHRADDLRRGDGLAARAGQFRSQAVRPDTDSNSDLRRADPARHPRSPAEEPRDPAQLSDRGTYAFPARGDPAGDAAVFLREREGRHAVLARRPRAGLPTRQDGARQASVRHPGGRLPRGL